MKKLLINLISFFAYHLRLWHIWYIWAGRLNGKKLLAVFVFHRVTDSSKSEEYFMYYEKGIGQEVFENQLKGIGEYFKFITLDEYLDILNGDLIPDRNCALITFDDTDSEFPQYVMPVLKKYNCPAVNFAPTAFIDSERRFWHLRLSNIIKNIDEEGWARIRTEAERLPGKLNDILLSSSISNVENRADTSRKLAKELVRFDHYQIDSIIDRWEALSGVEYNLGIKCLGWSDLRKLQEEEGTEIESHSVTHRRLATLNEDSITDELINSKKKLEEKLDKEVRTICYPAGSHNNTVVRLAEEAGYSAGFSSIEDWCIYPLEGPNRFKIPRFGIYGDSKYDVHRYLGRIAVSKILHNR